MPDCFFFLLAVNFQYLEPQSIFYERTVLAMAWLIFIPPPPLQEYTAVCTSLRFILRGNMLTMFSPNLFSRQHGSLLVSFCVVSFALSEIQLYSLAVTLSMCFFFSFATFTVTRGLRLTKALWHPVILTAYEQYFSLSRSDGREVTAITSLLFCVIITEHWSYVHAVVSLELSGGQARRVQRMTQTEKLIKCIPILTVLRFFFFIFLWSTDRVTFDVTNSVRKSKLLICIKSCAVHRHT